jgi:predicted Zn-dependent protease
VPTATERLLAPPDVERVFQAFVAGALAMGRQSRTARVDSDEIARAESGEHTDPGHASRPGSATQRLEAIQLVPDVAAVRPPETPVRERSEDGQIPARELEGRLGDMAVLLRYGHLAEVAERLDELLAKYPQDLLLLRRVAEFHLEHGHRELARECLFKLASGLFERRNVVGMRAALEQVLVLEPDNARALKLLALLDKREP